LLDAFDMRPALLSVSTVVALVCASCGGLTEPNDPNHCLSTGCSGGEQIVSIVAAPPPGPTDMLIVIDDLVPSSPDGAKLEQGLRDMMSSVELDVLSTRRGIDLNLALVSAAMDGDGAAATLPARLWPASSSCAQPNSSFLHATQICGDQSNFFGELSDVVACAALHMTASGKAPRPMAALRAVLDPGGSGERTGFRRPDARLLVAIVSTGDDPDLAAEGAVAGYHDYLAALVNDPDYRLMVGVVAPTAAQGLSSFSKSFGENGTFSDIAGSSWTSLAEMTYSTREGPSRPCIFWPVVDAKPDVEGIQPDCVATERDWSGTAWTEEILPPCPEDGANLGRCWRLSWDPNRCGPTGFELVVEPRFPVCLPSYPVMYTLTCATRIE
jgi:hypothetical protein